MGFLLAGSLLREINLLILMIGLMLGPLLLSWRQVIVSLRKIDVRRVLPESLAAGERLVVELEAENQRARGVSWAVVVEDRVARIGGDPRAAMTSSSLFPRLPPSDAQRCFYEGRLTQRGQYRFGPFKLSTRFPLGLIRGTLEIDRPAVLTVFPRLGALTPAWNKRRRESYYGSHTARRRQGFLEGEFHGLRDYRSGDAQRWIHWRTTARRGELMVRQFQQQHHHDLALMVDLWRPESPDDEDRDNVELAVSFAATIVSDHCRRGANFLMLGLAGGEVDLTQGAASRLFLQEAMTRLATACADSQDRLPELLSRGLDQVPSRCDVVIISTRRVDLADTQRFSELWTDPRKRSWAGRALCISTDGEELSRYFRVESS